MTVAELMEMDPIYCAGSIRAVDKNDLPLIVGYLKDKDKNVRSKALLLLLSGL